MAEEITLVERQEESALCISATVATMKLGKVIGPAYQSIISHLEKHNIKIGEKNIPFTIYKNLDWTTLNDKGIISAIKMMLFHKWEMEIGIPCPESIPEVSNIKRTLLEKGKYIRAIHKGPYRKVGDTYRKIRAFAGENKLIYKKYSIEFYLNDPRIVKSFDLETEVLVPVE